MNQMIYAGFLYTVVTGVGVACCIVFMRPRKSAEKPPAANISPREMHPRMLPLSFTEFRSEKRGSHWRTADGRYEIVLLGNRVGRQIDVAFESKGVASMYADTSWQSKDMLEAELNKNYLVRWRLDLTEGRANMIVGGNSLIDVVYTFLTQYERTQIPQIYERLTSVVEVELVPGVGSVQWDRWGP
ncbi:hypothetical protein [Sphingomonas immobilis]|uniref:Uncharacterized protein n=1 Tax=Sphingomonas immobilis TaxID=3063997 RepID=A0ABT8ZZ50_9SPHN|nr:hypothetical protein [Sphingomonas sp. CA1-15]MDO7842863.1 hypothetical protein [Sphingomonas sp. CA1-15]